MPRTDRYPSVRRLQTALSTIVGAVRRPDGRAGRRAGRPGKRVDTTTFGTLSLYADTPHAFEDATEPVARVLAVLAAITLSESRGRLNLEKALRAGT